MPRTPLLIAATVGVLGVGGVVAWQLLGDDDGDRRAAQAFADGWVEGNLAELRWGPGSGSDPAAQVAALTAGPAVHRRPVPGTWTPSWPAGADQAAT
ncbi:MAG: hypothetical protein AVDCRST_MAG66-1597 [uncultured Pseudonocardia sp.]|uniref:Uncharacterized protein n=1 Tax=uncultured Pseudonocardia sp. TaxID=211455 RepID=A0A6J4P3P6_9PSEU|nr:MAG: hypothetical protein AVDCRST_MAG66-1597 [uncultured Pseudonocardia sp.]